MNGTARRLLLGPQRPNLNLGEAVGSFGLPDGPLAVISAGWQEAENDLDDVQDVVGRPLEDLTLYDRAATVFAADPGLGDAHRERQQSLQELQRLYRLRLKSLALAARQVLDAGGNPDVIAPEQRHAIAQLRALDRHHLQRTEALHTAFSGRFDATHHPLIAEHRREIAEVLARCSGVLITGGNVIVLMNRMRLFDVGSLIADHDLIGWSAGAMVLTDRIVLYHDRMPLERRDPELFGAGCGLAPDIVLLPDPERRLRSKDHTRMSLLSRRFSPDACMTLSSGSAVTMGGNGIVAAEGAERVTQNGGLVEVRAA